MGRRDKPVSDESLIGSQMRLFRQEKGFSLTQMAQLINKSKGNLSALENNVGLPSREIVEAYERELHLQQESLLRLLKQIEDNTDVLTAIESQIEDSRLGDAKHFLKYDKAPGVRLSVVKRLGNIDSDDSLRLLRHVAYSDNDDTVRAVAADLLIMRQLQNKYYNFAKQWLGANLKSEADGILCFPRNLYWDLLISLQVEGKAHVQAVTTGDTLRRDFLIRNALRREIERGILQLGYTTRIYAFKDRDELRNNFSLLKEWATFAIAYAVTLDIRDQYLHDKKEFSIVGDDSHDELFIYHDPDSDEVTYISQNKTEVEKYSRQLTNLERASYNLSQNIVTQHNLKVEQVIERALPETGSMSHKVS